MFAAEFRYSRGQTQRSAATRIITLSVSGFVLLGFKACRRLSG